MGIWILYYLKFTNYQGIGLIETAWISFSIISEIPTGAIADLLGKKKTLIIAFFIHAISQFIMAFATSYSHLIASVLIGTLGFTLYSGAYEALVYDSLKQLKKQSTYNKVLANIQTISLLGWASASIVGGLVYSIWPGFPYALTGAFFFLGFLLTFFLKEPKVDTEKFTLSTYLTQTKQGFSQLFKPQSKIKIISLLIISALLVIPAEFLGDSVTVEFGFKDKELGFFYSGLFIFSALVAQLAPKFKQKLGAAKSFYLFNALYAMLMIPLAYLSKTFGGLALYLTGGLHHLTDNITSSAVNETIESKYRATSISTFNMLKLIPYALTAVFIGRFMDLFSARSFATYFGSIILIITIVLYLNYLKTKTKPRHA